MLAINLSIGGNISLEFDKRVFSVSKLIYRPDPAFDQAMHKHYLYLHTWMLKCHFKQKTSQTTI